MSTSYNIAVCESVSVKDIVLGAWRAVLHAVKSLAPITFFMTDGEEDTTVEDNKAPPTLGISVGEETHTTEALG